MRSWAAAALILVGTALYFLAHALMALGELIAPPSKPNTRDDVPGRNI